MNSKRIDAVWLRRVGGDAEVLIEIDCKWYRVIRECAENTYSHIAEIKNWSEQDLEMVEVAVDPDLYARFDP
jgi:SPX domain protein involved in polyphosphate accumulation